MRKASILLLFCLAVFFIMIVGIFSSPIFNVWKEKDVSRYYIGTGLEKTGSSSIVSAIVWDFRGFDTMGEETVLFTATAGILTLMIVDLKRRRR